MKANIFRGQGYTNSAPFKASQFMYRCEPIINHVCVCVCACVWEKVAEMCMNAAGPHTQTACPNIHSGAHVAAKIVLLTFMDSTHSIWRGGQGVRRDRPKRFMDA